MTKKKLILYLEDLPDDAEVYVPSGEKLGYVSPCWGILYDDETNSITFLGEDFDYLENSDERPAEKDGTDECQAEAFISGD